MLVDKFYKDGGKYKDFLIEDLFYKLNLKFTKENFDKRNDVSTIKTDEFSLPLVNAKNGDNGIMYYGRMKDFESEEMTIDIVGDGAVSTGNVYPQPQATGVLYNAYLIKCKNQISIESLIYYSQIIKKTIKMKFGYDKKATWERVKEQYIKMPINKNEEIDYQFIDAYVSELEEERVSELAAYLKVSGLDNYELSNVEKEILKKAPAFKTFKISNIFNIKSPSKKFNANAVTIYKEKIEGSFNYVVRTSMNNGVKGFLKQDIKYLSAKNTISLGQDTATIFYQDSEYFTGDKIKVLSFVNHELNPTCALYLLAAMRKAFSLFSWGQSLFNEDVLKNVEIKLPIKKDNEIDYEYIDNYITAMQKQVIRNVVIWKDNIIGKTKKVINDERNKMNEKTNV